MEFLNLIDRILLKVFSSFFVILFFALSISYALFFGIVAPVYIFAYLGKFIYEHFGFLGKGLSFGFSFVIIISVCAYIVIRIKGIEDILKSVFINLLELGTKISSIIDNISHRKKYNLPQKVERIVITIKEVKNEGTNRK